MTEKLIKAMEVLNSLSLEGNIKFDKEKIELNAIHPAGFAFIEIELLKKNLTEGVVFLSYRAFLSALKKFKGKEISLIESENKLIIKSEKNEAEITVYDEKPTKRLMPSKQPEHKKFTFTSKDFDQLVKDVKGTDSFKLKTSEGELVLTVKNKDFTYKNRLQETDANLKLSCSSDLINHLAAIVSEFDILELWLASDLPVFISAKNDLLKLNYVFAPRIEN